jgi:hypothetical protein
MAPLTIARAKAILVATLALQAGCSSVPPDRIAADRMDFGQVIVESWKRQTLLNVVRLRYGDAPMFLDVASVINSYSIGGKASASGSFPSASTPNVLGLGAEGTWSNTPTVTYQPLMGDRFTRSMLHPVPPTAVFQMLQAGWPTDLVLSTVITSINGLRNASISASGDAEFSEMVAALTRVQTAGGLAIRVEARKDGTGVVILFRGAGDIAATAADRRRVRELLNLDPAAGEFAITYGVVSQGGREIAVLTRSMFEIMMYLGIGIELPADHVSDGRTPPRPDASIARVPVRIRSGAEAPAESYTSVRYRDRWYWIDETDYASKRTFTFMMILFSLAETGQSTAAPVVTVPSR